MTNATKAVIISLVNATLGLLIAFGVVLTPAQVGAIGVFANAVFTVIVALTYKNSAKRVPDGAPVAVDENGDAVEKPQRVVVS